MQMRSKENRHQLDPVIVVPKAPFRVQLSPGGAVP